MNSIDYEGKDLPLEESKTQRHLQNATIDSEPQIHPPPNIYDQHIEKIEKKQNQQRSWLLSGCILSILGMVALGGLWAWSVSSVTR